MCNNFITKWGKYNCKLGQLRVITKGHEISKTGAVNSLQSEAIIITQSGMYYKKRPLYYKVGQVLQSEATITEKGQYIFVTIGQRKTHVYWQGKCGLRTEIYRI